MKTAFLIVNYNDAETTIELLENIRNFKALDLIVVIDNASTNDSYLVLKKKFENKKIHILEAKSNNGYAAGINYGSKYIIDLLGNCNIIVSNPDIVIYKEEDILNMISKKADDIGIIAPIIKEHTGLNRGWRIPTPLQDAILNIVYFHRFLRPILLFYKEDHYNLPLAEVEAVSGCFFLIESKCLQQVNYFDENVFLYYEENIIGKKMQTLNKKVVIDTETEVFHNHSVTIDKTINHKNKYKELKKSQYYFQTVYNNANFLEKLLLKLTDFASYFVISILK